MADTKAKQHLHRDVARGVFGQTLRVRFALRRILAEVEELGEAADHRHDWSPGGGRFARAEDKWIAPEDVGDDPLFPYGKVRQILDLLNEAARLNEDVRTIAERTTWVQRPGYPDSRDAPFALTDDGVTFRDAPTPFTREDLVERGVSPGQ